MRRTALRITLMIAFVLSPGLRHTSAEAADPAVNWSRIAQRVVPAIVNIVTDRIARKKDGSDYRESFSGSGVIIDPSGEIVTNKHVIAGGFRITVTLHDGTTLRARLVAAAAMSDLAVLKVDAGRPLPSLKLGDSDMVKIGQPVLAVGNPLGIGTSLSSGIVSAVNRNLRKTPFDDYIQTDAALNHGNSGGPLIDTQGEVIGIDTILLTNTANEGSNGLGFAIASTVVDYVVRHLRDPASAPVGWIGIQMQDVTSDLASALRLPRPGGFIVTGIDPDSPAEQAGLRVGDIVLRYDGARYSDARALMRAITISPIGEKAELVVWTKGRQQTMQVVTRNWPDLMEARGTTLAAPGALLPVPPPDLGMLLAPITDMARRRYSLDKIQGVLVVAVDSQSEAYGLGISPGVVIESVQGQPVTSPSQVLRLVRSEPGHGHLVAMLVRWKDETRWITLHSGYAATPAEVSAELRARAATMVRMSNAADAEAATPRPGDIGRDRH